MNVCMNQDPVTKQYCGKPSGHTGPHMNLHSLMQWVPTTRSEDK